MKMEKRNILSIILVSLVLIVMCSSSVCAIQEMVDVEKYKKEPPYKVAFDIYYQGNEWGVLLLEEFKDEVANHPDLISEAFYTDSEGDTAKQIANIEDLIVRDPDILVMTPNAYTSLNPVIEKAYDKGIAIILCATEASTERYTSYINVDDGEWGKTNAEWVAEAIGYEGNVVAFSGIAGSSTAEDRWEAASAVFDKYPKIKIIAHEYADWNYTTAKMAMENIVVAHPKIDGIWSGGEQMTKGCIEVLLAAGRDLCPVTGGENNGFLKLVKEHDVKFYAQTKPTWLSREALLLALDILQGKPVPKINLIEGDIITDENIDEYLRPDLPDSFATGTRLPDEIVLKLFPSGE
jgi:ribose transport system substrate-binding protein